MKCILVPIDFSDVTPPVIDLARQLAKALGEEIHICGHPERSEGPHARAAGHTMDCTGTWLRLGCPSLPSG